MSNKIHKITKIIFNALIIVIAIIYFILTICGANGVIDLGLNTTRSAVFTGISTGILLAIAIDSAADIVDVVFNKEEDENKDAKN